MSEIQAFCLDLRHVCTEHMPMLCITGFKHHYDVCVIGGGIVGCSVAYWLAQRVNKGLEICVIERDPSVSFKTLCFFYLRARYEIYLRNLQTMASNYRA